MKMMGGSASSVMEAPLAINRRGADASSEREGQPVKSPKDFPLAVLLIDDVKTLLTVLKSGLEKMGWTIHTASSGEAGLEIFRAEPIDVVVCDLGMDGMDGVGVSREIDTLCSTKGVSRPPFVLLTGWTSAGGDQACADEPHIDRVIEKPVEIMDLVRTCMELVGPSKEADHP